MKDTELEKAQVCTFQIVNKITAPIYSMSQATGYKHTSNKELPAEQIPWCQYYYPSTKVYDKEGIKFTSEVNKLQRFPFFTVVQVTKDKIRLDVRKINNVLVEGKFNINEQGEQIKTGQLQVTTKNGINGGEANTETHIEILK